MGKTYCVYILSSRSRVLYTGVTSRLLERVKEHRDATKPSFTQRYRIHRLVYFEAFGNAKSAIACEKLIKSYTRTQKNRVDRKKKSHLGRPSSRIVPAVSDKSRFRASL